MHAPLIVTHVLWRGCCGALERRRSQWSASRCGICRVDSGAEAVATGNLHLVAKQWIVASFTPGPHCRSPKNQEQLRRRTRNEERSFALLAGLAADTQFGDQRTVPLDIIAFEVVEQAPTPTDEHQQAPPRVMVLFVGLQVLGEVLDAFGQQRDLDLRGPSVGVVTAVFGDRGGLVRHVRKKLSQINTWLDRLRDSPEATSEATTATSQLPDHPDPVPDPVLGPLLGPVVGTRRRVSATSRFI